jgi:hypothetical protein
MRLARLAGKLCGSRAAPAPHPWDATGFWRTEKAAGGPFSFYPRQQKRQNKSRRTGARPAISLPQRTSERGAESLPGPLTLSNPAARRLAPWRGSASVMSPTVCRCFGCRPPGRCERNPSLQTKLVRTAACGERRIRRGDCWRRAGRPPNSDRCKHRQLYNPALLGDASPLSLGLFDLYLR